MAGMLHCSRAFTAWLRHKSSRFCCRRFCIATGECEPPVHGSFYTSRVESDGRLFSFATVAVRSMVKGQSALPAWSQACSLLGTSEPTLAMVFVSKSSPEAASAIEEVANAFSNGSSGSSVPLIGCVADLWQPGAPATGSPPGGGGRANKRVGPAVLPPGYRLIPVPGLETKGEAIKADTEVQVLQLQRSCSSRETASESEEDEVADFKALMGECRKWSRENPGVISDDETLASLENQIKSPGDVLEGIKQKEREEEPALAKETEESKSEDGATSKSSRANEIPVAVKAKEAVAVEQAMPETTGLVAESTSSTEGASSGSSVEGTSAGNVGDEQPVEETEDQSFHLVFCVGHLPGVQAASFHTSTTGLPSLPNMEAAVTRDNPHMILLGAPGYPFPEFVQRLAIMFPDSSRAGAFLSPLFNNPRAKPDQTKPLFYGSKHTIGGVVGLAISSDGEHANVPMDVLTECLRMSLGMARVTGHTFFDNAISTRLFFPSNVVVERQASALSTPVDPNAFLKRLHTYLTRRNKLQSQTTGPTASKHPQPSRVEVTVDGTKTCTLAVEVQDSCSVPSESRLEDGSSLESTELVPLALMDTVLFPGFSIPLHIYEPRYRQLVRDCVERSKPFGLASYWHWHNPTELFGTMADMKVYLFEKDCRSYVVAHGTRRFRVPFDRMTVQPGSFGLHVAQVEFLEDAGYEQNEEVLEIATQAVERCRQVIPEAVDFPGLNGEITDPTAVSFAIAQILPVPVRVKRRWLGMVDAKHRLLEQMTFLNS